MNTLSIMLLQAEAGAAPNAAPQGGGMSMIFFLLAIFAVMYFFMIRPQNKKQKEIVKFRNSLQPGQDVITIGGIHGTIKNINDADNTVTLEVATGTKMVFEKSAIMPREQQGK